MLAACILLSGCADIAIVDTTPQPTANLETLPPIGFNHRYGNNPVAAQDGFKLERSLFAQRVFWEVAIRALPEEAGYVDLSNPQRVRAARHATTSLNVVIATENRATIVGLLAFSSNAGQEHKTGACL